MKNSKQGIAPLLVIVVGLVIIGAGYLFFQKQSPQNEIENVKKYFPDAIGSFTLYGRNPEKIRMTIECEKLQDHPDSKGSGLQGEICGRSIIGEYRDSNTNKVVFVHLAQFTSGKRVYKEFIEKSVKKDVLNGQNIFRIERPEIGWFPAQTFGAIITQEGVVKTEADGGENIGYSYTGVATGNNPVLKYFIEKYPPGTSDSDSDIPERVLSSLMCKDSDDGLDYYTKGTVRCPGSTYTDYCQVNDVPNTLIEYVSNGNSVGTPSYVCPNGCRDGACVK